MELWFSMENHDAMEKNLCFLGQNYGTMDKLRYQINPPPHTHTVKCYEEDDYCLDNVSHIIPSKVGVWFHTTD